MLHAQNCRKKAYDSGLTNLERPKVPILASLYRNFPTLFEVLRRDSGVVDRCKTAKLDTIRTNLGAALPDSINVAISMFPNGSLSDFGLASACEAAEAALYQKLNCDPNVASLMTDDYPGSFGNATLTSLVCDAGCTTSIGQLHNAVLSKCGKTAEMIPGLSYLGTVDKL